MEITIPITQEECGQLPSKANENYPKNQKVEKKKMKQQKLVHISTELPINFVQDGEIEENSQETFRQSLKLPALTPKTPISFEETHKKYENRD